MNNKSAKDMPPLFDGVVRKIGIVSRDYNFRYPNGYRDFSYVLPEVLTVLDERDCDVALFSLYSIIPRKGYDVRSILSDYANLKMVCLEEFKDYRKGRKAGDYVVYYRMPAGWQEHRFRQIFGKVNWQTQGRMLRKFIEKELPRRVMGNTAILVCGESNGVKYDKAGSKTIIDPCGLVDAISDNVQIIFNPVHDRMSRFEMAMKRKFLSQRERVVVSVWNRGKQDKYGKARDGENPPWKIYHAGEPIYVPRMITNLNVDLAYINVPLLAEF